MFPFTADDPCDLKSEISPNMENEITAKERGVLEENNEKEVMDQETAQEEEDEEEEEGEERKQKEEEVEGEDKSGKEEEEEEELLTGEQELEELRSQVLQLLLELDGARETSNKHQESFNELQGETTGGLVRLSSIYNKHLKSEILLRWIRLCHPPKKIV